MGDVAAVSLFGFFVVASTFFDADLFLAFFSFPAQYA